MLRVYWHIFVRPYWLLVLAAISCFLIASIAGLGAPLVIKALLDGALERKDIAALHYIILTIVLLYLIRAVFLYFYNFAIAMAGNQMITELRKSIFIKLQSLDYAYFVNTPAGDAISLFTNDLLLLQQAVAQGIPDAIVEALNLVAILAIMIYFDWELALVTVTTLPFIVAAISCFNKKIVHLATIVEYTLAKVTALLHQSILSVRLVKSYVREDYEYARFRVKIRQAAAELVKVQRYNSVLVSLVEFLAAIGITIIIWYGGKEVIQGDLTIGGMFAFLVYIINLPTPVRKVSQALGALKLGTVAWQRIQAFEKLQRTVTEGAFTLPNVTGVVEFRGVSFSYGPERATLEDINFVAKPNQVIAIVGPSGAGKSSIANLLLRFYDPTQGAILLDGIDIRTLTLHSLRNHIGFIQQEPILFNTSILENIRYGRPDATEAEVVQAAKLANAHDFICALPRGYQTMAGELGNSLSGGQRQRIAIARAIITKPAILLLDEPTAALDAQAEKQVMAAIRAAAANRTVIMITHRLSTVVATDIVVYLAQGRIQEIGTHAQLIARNGCYAKAVKLGAFQVYTNEN